jgi:hypothetical protein
MKRGWYPVDQPVLDRIDMNIVDMPGEIDFVANGVRSISALPDAPLTLGGPAAGYSFVSRQAARKGGLDQLPAHGKIGITFGQRPYGVKVIRQHHDGIDREGMAPVRLTKRRAQQLDTIREQR